MPFQTTPSVLLAGDTHHTSPSPRRDAIRDAETQVLMQRILEHLSEITGHDFSLYKTGTLYRRIERRLSIRGIGGIVDYADYLEQDRSEAKALFKDLFIGVTSFFRDPAAFEALRNDVLPELLKGRGPDDTVRMWVAGCSTGEEAYSLMMALQECFDQLPERVGMKTQVFATDIDAAAIDTARRGIYSANALEGVSPERLDRFFIRTGEGYQVKADIRDAVVFAQHNIISDPPFIKLDLISCRNMLIYFSPELQKNLIPIFHYALNADGTLFLGSSETANGYTNLFSTIDGKWKLFKRNEVPRTGMVDLWSARAALKCPKPEEVTGNR